MAQKGSSALVKRASHGAFFCEICGRLQAPLGVCSANSQEARCYFVESNQKRHSTGYWIHPLPQKVKKHRRINEAAIEYYEATHSEYWYYLKKDVIQERGYECEDCGVTRALELHHKTYERLGEEEMGDVELLCRRCHGEGRHGHKDDSQLKLDFQPPGARFDDAA